MLLSPDVSVYAGLDKYLTGDMVLCVFSTMDGLNQEDSVILNKRSVENGMFRMVTRDTYKIPMQSSGKKNNLLRHITRKPSDTDTQLQGQENLDYRGIVKEGTEVVEGDVLVSGYLVDRKNEVRLERPRKAEIKKLGVVEGVNITDRYITIRVVATKNIQVGDKLTFRYAQKGTVGAIYPEEKMPRISADAKCPEWMRGVYADVIFNPLGQASRMTAGMFLEMMAALIALEKGGIRVNANAYGDIDKYRLMDELEKIGINRDGTVKMTIEDKLYLYD